jgi:hypothetical protein
LARFLLDESVLNRSLDWSFISARTFLGFIKKTEVPMREA